MAATQGKVASAGMPHVDEHGLDDDAVQTRVEQGQTNRTDESTSRSVGSIIRANVFTLFNAIILTAMVVVLLTGSWKDAVFGLVIIINTGIAFSIMPASVACWGIDGVVFRPMQGFRAKARTLLVYPRGSQVTGIQSFVSLIKPKR